MVLLCLGNFRPLRLRGTRLPLTAPIVGSIEHDDTCDPLDLVWDGIAEVGLRCQEPRNVKSRTRRGHRPVVLTRERQPHQSRGSANTARRTAQADDGISVLRPPTPPGAAVRVPASLTAVCLARTSDRLPALQLTTPEHLDHFASRSILGSFPHVNPKRKKVLMRPGSQVRRDEVSTSRGRDRCRDRPAAQPIVASELDLVRRLVDEQPFCLAERQGERRFDPVPRQHHGDLHGSRRSQARRERFAGRARASD